MLSVADEDAITIDYVDADDGDGHFNLPRQVVVRADCRAPIVSRVQALRVTDERAEITWSTDEPATSRLAYWRTPGDVRLLR
jgi:hypothetical protein